GEAARHYVRERDDEGDHQDLDQYKRDRTPVDLASGNRRRFAAGDAIEEFPGGRNAAQIEERESKRWMHERRLHVDAEQHAEPDEIDAELFRHRSDQWNDDERQLEEVEEEGQDENQDVDDDQEPELSARKARKQMLDPDMAVDAIEREAEYAGTDQDEDDERRELGRRVHRLLQEREGQAPTRDRHDQCAGRAHGPAFGRRGHTKEDRAQHEEDERERRNKHEGHALGNFRQHPQLGQLVDDGDDERNADSDRHRDDDTLVGGDIWVVFVVIDEPERGGDGRRKNRQCHERAVARHPTRISPRA